MAIALPLRRASWCLLAGTLLLLCAAHPSPAQNHDLRERKEIDEQTHKQLRDKIYMQCLHLAESKDSAQQQQAVAPCTQTIEKFPLACWGYHARGLAYAALGKLDEAIQDGEMAQKLLPQKGSRGYVEDWVNSANLRLSSYYHQRATRTAAGGTAAASKVLADETRALELTPQNFWARFARAHWLFLANRPAESAADFDQFLKQYTAEPYQTIALVVQARAYLQINNKAAALANVQRIVATQPRLAAQYGANALDLLDADKRRQQTRTALQQALAAEQQGDFLKAFQDYNRARGFPLFIRAYSSQDFSWAEGLSKEDMALLHEMIPVLPRIYPKLPAQPALPEEARRLAVQAELASKDSRYKEALALYSQLEEISPWWPQAHFNRANLLAQQGQMADGIAEMKNYLSFAPDASDARLVRDKIYVWESLAARAQSLLKSLEGSWACTWSQSSSITSYYDLRATNDAQFEMSPVKKSYTDIHYVPGPFGLPGHVAYDPVSASLSREKEGYAFLAIQESGSLLGTYNNPSGANATMMGEIGADHVSMTLSRGPTDQAMCQKQQ